MTNLNHQMSPAVFQIQEKL